MPKVNELPRVSNPNPYNRAMAEVWNYSPTQGGVGQTSDAKKVYEASTKVAATPMSEKNPAPQQKVGQNGAPLPVENVNTSSPQKINVTSDLEKIGAVGGISSDKLQNALGGCQKKIAASTKAEGQRNVSRVAKKSADQLRAAIKDSTPASEKNLYVERKPKSNNTQAAASSAPAAAPATKEVTAQFKTQIEGKGASVKETA